MKKIKLLFALFICVICLLSFRQNKDIEIVDIKFYMDSLRTAMIGKEFVNLTFESGMENFKDIKSLRGNVIAINIWAFSCKPCMEEIPGLNLLVDKYKNDSVKFISLLGFGKADLKDSSLISRLKTLKFKYNTISLTNNLTEYYDYQLIFPQHILIDKNGIVVDYFFGPYTERLDSLINKLR